MHWRVVNDISYRSKIWSVSRDKIRGATWKAFPSLSGVHDARCATASIGALTSSGNPADSFSLPFSCRSAIPFSPSRRARWPEPSAFPRYIFPLFFSFAVHEKKKKNGECQCFNFNEFWVSYFFLREIVEIPIIEIYIKKESRTLEINFKSRSELSVKQSVPHGFIYFSTTWKWKDRIFFLVNNIDCTTKCRDDTLISSYSIYLESCFFSLSLPLPGTAE